MFLYELLLRDESVPDDVALQDALEGSGVVSSDLLLDVKHGDVLRDAQHATNKKSTFKSTIVISQIQDRLMTSQLNQNITKIQQREVI